MADNRKYYYLKLKDNYFDDDSIVLLESMQDGMIYSNTSYEGFQYAYTGAWNGGYYRGYYNYDYDYGYGCGSYYGSGAKKRRKIF